MMTTLRTDSLVSASMFTHPSAKSVSEMQGLDNNQHKEIMLYVGEQSNEQNTFN